MTDLPAPTPSLKPAQRAELLRVFQGYNGSPSRTSLHAREELVALKLVSETHAPVVTPKGAEELLRTAKAAELASFIGKHLRELEADKRRNPTLTKGLQAGFCALHLSGTYASQGKVRVRYLSFQLTHTLSLGDARDYLCYLRALPDDAIGHALRHDSAACKAWCAIHRSVLS